MAKPGFAISVEAGDMFCTRNPMALGRGINFCQTITSRDGKSVYSHSGLIIDGEGNTFEALWTIKRQNLFEAYAGQQVVIARWDRMTPKIFKAAFKQLTDQHEDKWYPFWRVPLNISPTVAKYTTLGGRYVVCSELVAKFLYIVFCDFGNIGIGGYCWPRHKYFTGTNPDTLADEWHRWKQYNIVYEGALP